MKKTHLWKQGRIATMVFLAAAASGCVLPPKDAPRAAALDEGSLHLGPSAVSPAPEGWWKAFGDPQLDTLIEAALANNPNLAQALDRVREAEAQTASARAGLLPTVNASGNLTRLHAPEDFAIPPPLAGGELWSGIVGANLSWDIDFWGRQADAVAAAKAATGAAQMEVLDARLMLAGAIAQAYVDLYRNFALADLADTTAQQRAHILEITRRRVEAGLDTRVELRAAEGALPQARIDQARAQNAEALAIHQLAALCGRGGQEAYASIGRPNLRLDAALPLPEELPINLLARRPDILAARLRVHGADARRLADKAAFYPTVNLMAFAGYASFGLSNLFDFNNRSYGGGGLVRMPLFDGGRLSAEYRGSEAALDDAMNDYNATVLEAVRQVADQLSEIQSLAREMSLQQEALDSAEEQYRLTEERYRAGLTNYLSVLNADTQVLSARRGRIDIGAAQVISRVTLLLAVGGSFDPPTVTASASPAPLSPPLAIASQVSP